MNLEKIPFDLENTLCCGQVFRWQKKGDWWYGVVKDKVFKVRKLCTEFEIESADEKFVRNYFGLNDDLMRIRREIDKDKQINEALKQFWGLRIIKQDPWECLISYICATYKNIAAIKLMLQKLSEKFGNRLSLDDYEFYSFPTPKRLARSTMQELQRCGLGYRAKFVFETSRKIFEENLEIDNLRNTSYQKAKEELTTLPGVGLKVADCVLLFSLEKTEAFPIDRWIERVLAKYYDKHFPDTFMQKLATKESLSKTDYEKLNAFGRDYFGRYAGYAQEYLYHYERSKN